MTFQTKTLMGERVLVTGTDIEGTKGQAILDASQWNELKARQDLKTAGAEFDAAVEAFYAPILEAAEKLGKVVDKPEDSLSFVVLDEGSDGVAAKPQHVVRLSKDSMVLRLIEDGNTDRLVWVGDELEILEVLPGTGNTGVVASGADVIGEENMPAEDDPFN